MKAKQTEPVLPFQWTNGGNEVLILRYVTREGKAYGEFQHPLKVGEIVTAPDWDKKAECGGGIHGWPWGLSMGDGKEADWSALWQVYGVNPKHIVDLQGKCKFKTGTLRFIGDWHAAMMFVLAGQMAWVHETSRGAASSTGYSGAASSTGDRGAASSTGDSGAASSTGYSGAASSTGYSGAASSTGDRGAASSTGYSGAASSTGYSGAASSTGYSGAASSTGECSSAAVTNLNGRAMGGEFGCIALAWWNKKEERAEMRCALTGSAQGSLKPHVWYTLDEKGNFVEVPA